jgi:hypothetical protein
MSDSIKLQFLVYLPKGSLWLFLPMVLPHLIDALTSNEDEDEDEDQGRTAKQDLVELPRTSASAVLLMMLLVGVSRRPRPVESSSPAPVATYSFYSFSTPLSYPSTHVLTCSPTPPLTPAQKPRPVTVSMFSR